MPPDTKPKTNQETWVDWLGDASEPDQLYTRDEIVDRVNALIRPGMKPVKAGDLQLWEKLGILPRAVRRRHGNAQFALYPDWHAYLARQVRALQWQGYSLDEIRPQIRNYARQTLRIGRSEIDEEIGNADTPERLMLRPALTSELEDLAERWSRVAGVDADRIEVHVIGKNGRATMYPWRIAPYSEGEIEN